MAPAALTPQAPPTVLTEDITVSVPNAPAVTTHGAVDPLRQYVAAPGYNWMPTWLRVLAGYTDDLDRDFGAGIWDSMLHDPAVVSATRLLRTGATSQDAVVTPAVDAEACTQRHVEWAQADRIAMFCKRNLRRVPLPAILYELTEAITHGHCLAEQVWELATLDPADGPQLVLQALKPKARETYAFVQTPYGDVPGVQYAGPGQPLIVGGMAISDAQGHLVNFLPREKFVLYTYNPRHGDPRGNSVLRGAYVPWWLKTQLYPDYKMYLANFAMPMLWGTTAPGAQQGDDGLSPQQTLINQMQTLRNGGVLGMEAGGMLGAIQSQSDGRPFLAAMDWCNREITGQILGATRATMEAEHGSKADSGAAQDVLELSIQRLRTDLAAVIARDVLTPLIRLNYGDGALKYLPIVSLGESERHDLPAVWTALAALDGTSVVHRSMLPAIRNQAGLPPADEEAEAADQAKAAALTDRLASAPQTPQDGTPPPPPGQPPAGPQKPPPTQGAPQEKPV